MIRVQSLDFSQLRRVMQSRKSAAAPTRPRSTLCPSIKIRCGWPAPQTRALFTYSRSLRIARRLLYPMRTPPPMTRKGPRIKNMCKYSNASFNTTVCRSWVASLNTSRASGASLSSASRESAPYADSAKMVSILLPLPQTANTTSQRYLKAVDSARK